MTSRTTNSKQAVYKSIHHHKSIVTEIKNSVFLYVSPCRNSSTTLKMEKKYFQKRQ
jgi:hypothetical protein